MEQIVDQQISPRFSTKKPMPNIIHYIPEEDETDMLYQIKGVSNDAADEWDYHLN